MGIARSTIGIVSTYYYYPGFAYANEIPAVLPMLCMLAARDFAPARRDYVYLLCVIDMSEMKAGRVRASRRICEFTGLLPDRELRTRDILRYNFNAIFLPPPPRGGGGGIYFVTCYGGNSRVNLAQPRKGISFVQITFQH